MKRYERITRFFWRKFRTVPTGCPECQPNGGDADGWITVTTASPKPCPGCGKVGSRFYAPAPDEN